MKLNILIITQYYWPENFRINDLSLELKERGHSITILTGLPNYPKGDFYSGYGLNSVGKSEKNNIKIIRVPLFPRKKGKSWSLILNYFSFSFFASIMGPFFANEKYDLIFVYEPSPIFVGLPAIIIKYIKKIPIIFWIQDLWPESIMATKQIKSKVIIAPLNYFVKWLYKKCDLIFVQSKGFIDSVMSFNVKKEKIIYIPNWAEDLYKEKEIRIDRKKELGITDGDFIIMFAGNLGSAQSLETIVETANVLKNDNFKFVIIGDGRKKQWFINQIEIKNLTNSFIIIDQKPQELMPSYFFIADLMLVTLKSNPIFALTIPGKIQSYMASGKPIVASIDGVGARVVNDSNSGIAVAAQNYEKLADAIIKLSKSDLSLIGNNSFNYCEKNFNRKKIIDKIESIFESVI